MFQLSQILMQREHKALIWNLSELENWNSTQLPPESELSYHIQIQVRICNVPASEIF